MSQGPVVFGVVLIVLLLGWWWWHKKTKAVPLEEPPRPLEQAPPHWEQAKATVTRAATTPVATQAATTPAPAATPQKEAKTIVRIVNPAGAIQNETVLSVPSVNGKATTRIVTRTMDQGRMVSEQVVNLEE